MTWRNTVKGNCVCREIAGIQSIDLDRLSTRRDAYKLCVDEGMTTLSKWTANQVKDIIINPFYAIQMNPALSAEHPPIVSKDQWVQANVSLINEMGPEKWLRFLLQTLETGG